MKSYLIHFIRHGSVDETLAGKYIGTTDVSLSEEGKEELRKLKELCDYPPTQVVFTSPLKRCTETCRILYPEISPLSIANLREYSFGEWEGKTAEDLQTEPVFERWLAGDYDAQPPHGESNADFLRRVITTLLAVYGLPQAKPFEWVMANGNGYSLRVTPMLWQRDKVAEVYSRLPILKEIE